MRVFAVIVVLTLAGVGLGKNSQELSRSDFPPEFIFGAGTSAYQVEGAAAEDGRTPSVWDTCAHAGIYKDNSTGDIACDQYHKYREDVQIMNEVGLDAYRFSISWSRLLPKGRGVTNPKGLQYYNNLINELISRGIQPHVTLFHYDLPQTLEDEYGGWLSQKIVKDFKAYAQVCFREFGDRVSFWTTLNEPNVLALGGYDVGTVPPQRCSPPFGSNCRGGNSILEPYIVTHNMLLAHAAAATLYKKKYQAKQHGFIGMNLFAYWFVPLTSTFEDVSATQRANDFYTGWFANPLVFGDYPNTMKKNAGPKIPAFTKYQSKQVMDSFDFFGLNHYATLRVKDDPNTLEIDERDIMGDMCIKLDGSMNWSPGSEFPVFPPGMRGVLEYFKQLYGNPPIYIHENGYMGHRNEAFNDSTRVEYLNGFLGSLLDAVRNGSDTRGYFVWSFMDTFELLNGYQSRFGLYHVDFNDKNLTRSPKLSAHWYTNFLRQSHQSSTERTSTVSPTPLFQE